MTPTFQQKSNIAQYNVVTAQHELATAQDELATAQHRLAVAQHDLPTAQHELTTAQHEFATAQNKLTIVDKHKAIPALNQNVTVMEKHVATLKKHVAALSKDVTILPKHIDTIKERIVTMKEHVNAMAVIKAEAEAEVLLITTLHSHATDCLRLSMHFFHPIQQCAQQIYHTALPLSPTSSWLYKSCLQSVVDNQLSPVTAFSGAPDTWGLLLRTIDVQPRKLTCIATSFQRIIAACGAIVNVYDAVTGVL